MNDGPGIFTALLLFAVGISLVWAFDTVLAYVAVEAVGGHDLELREAAGIGLLLTALQASASVRSE